MAWLVLRDTKYYREQNENLQPERKRNLPVAVAALEKNPVFSLGFRLRIIYN